MTTKSSNRIMALGLSLLLAACATSPAPDPMPAKLPTAIPTPARTTEDSAGRKQNAEGLVAQFPAPSVAEHQRLCAGLATLGSAGVGDVASLLAAPETGGDFGPRFALSSWAKYASRQDGKSDRSAFVEGIIAALPTSTNTENTAFLIRQLEWTAQDESVEALSAYLSDDALCDPAVVVLVQIASPKAVSAMANALPDSRGVPRLALTKALGELRHAGSVKHITQTASSTDAELQDVSRYALANIGAPGSEKLLQAALNDAESRYAASRATSHLLLYARTLAANGHSKTAISICRSVLERADLESSARAAAEKTLGEVDGN